MNAQISQRVPASEQGCLSLEDALVLIHHAPAVSVTDTDGGEKSAEPQQVPPENLTTVINMQSLLARCLGNMQLVLRVLAKFQNTGGADLQQIEVAIELSDFETIAKLSHRFKGAAGNISAERLRLIATYIEQSAREQSLSEIREAFSQARAEWEQFVQFASAIAPQDDVTKTSTKARAR